MTSHSVFRRWLIFVPGIVGSFLPALLLTTFWARPGRYWNTLLLFWKELLVGPVNYWVPILLGEPSKYGLHPMAGVSTWLFAVCFLMTLAHPIKPRPLTAVVTSAGFVIWYGWAFLALNAFEY
jgi:hypothetical protein